MIRKSKLTEQQITERYQAYEKVNDIAKDAGISRQAVRDALIRVGVYDPRRGTQKVRCMFCGEMFEQFRAYVKEYNYCSSQCYHAGRSVCGMYSERGVQLTALESGGPVPHYINGDQTDRREENVRWFDSHTEHMRFHHELRRKQRKRK